jgi:predicted GIY-YIG superfamily endonuclease
MSTREVRGVSTGLVLYRMFAADGRLLYVGQTSNPPARIGAHKRSRRSWWREVETIKLTHFDDRDKLLAAEVEAIETEHPLCNTAHRTVPINGDLTPELDAMLEDARRAREGRERWRNVAPILRELRELGVSYGEIKAATGIAPATVARIQHRSRTGGST